MFDTNSPIVTRVDPDIITYSLNKTNIPAKLIQAVNNYFSSLNIRNTAPVLSECIKELNNAKCSATTNNDSMNHLRTIHAQHEKSENAAELVSLYSKILCSIGAVVMGSGGSNNQALFYTGVNLGANAYLASILRKRNINPGSYISQSEMNDLDKLRNIVASCSGNSMGNDAFGGNNSGGFNINTNRGNSNGYNSTTVTNGDNVNLFGESKAFSEVTTFGGGDSWSHTNRGGTEVFSATTNSGNFEQPAQASVNTQSPNNQKPYTPKQSGELIAMQKEWDKINTQHATSEFKPSDEDAYEEEDEAAEKPKIICHLDGNEGKILSLSNAARLCLEHRETPKQFVSMLILSGEDISLTDKNIANIESIRAFMRENDTVLRHEDDMRYGSNTYQYVVNMIMRIDDNFIRYAMLSYMQSLINNYVIIRAGIAMLLIDVVKDSNSLNKRLRSNIQSDSFVGTDSERAIFNSAVTGIERAICKNVLSKLAIFNADDESALMLADPVMVIASPLTATELGLQFDAPLVANRITKNTTPQLWDIIDDCLESAPRRPKEICIYTADGKYITGYDSVFCDDYSIIDLFDLSEVAHYLKM